MASKLWNVIWYAASGAIQFIYNFTGEATTNISNQRELVNSGSGDNLLIKTGDGIDASTGATITLPATQYVYAAYYWDMTDSSQQEQIINKRVDSFVITHANPINSIAVVGA